MLLRPEICGNAGAVAATHWLAAQAGMTMLDRGGNAFDAATAAGLVLQVVEPHLNGPGGDVPIVLHDATSGAVKVICGQGPMPQAATIAHFREQVLAGYLELFELSLPLVHCSESFLGVLRRASCMWGELPAKWIVAYMGSAPH